MNDPVREKVSSFRVTPNKVDLVKQKIFRQYVGNGCGNAKT